MLTVETLRAMRQELEKIAAVSSPANISPGSPSGDGRQMLPTPAAPVPVPKMTAKVLSKTNLQKTNYTSVNTEVPPPDVSLTSEQKGIQPPAVRS